MDPVSIILVIIAAGSVATSVIIVFKKNVRSLSCFCCKCVQQVGSPQNQSDSDRSNGNSAIDQIQKGIMSLNERLRRSLTPRKRPDIAAAAVSASVNIEKVIEKQIE